MATTLTVHIGARKTGTTFVQRALQERHESLLANGILYPTHYRPGNGDYNHVAAVYDVMRQAGRSARRWEDLPHGTHETLAATINAHSGPAIISAEALSALPVTDIKAFLEPFDSRLRVVATARDLGRVLPSSWQQHVRNTHTETFAEYILRRAQERADDVDAWESGDKYSFWRMFAYDRLARRWAQIVGPENFHIVTAPPPGADSSVLWRRFCAAAALPEAVAADIPIIPALTANAGSTAAEAEFLRALNERGRALNMDRREIKRMQREAIAALLERPDRGAPLRLPSSAVDVVRAWADHDRTELAGLGVNVHGDLGDLTVLDSSASSASISAEEVAAVGAFLTIHSKRPQQESAVIRLARRMKRS